MKYKIGDKVRVREDLEVNSSYNHLIFFSGMEEFKGKEVTIHTFDVDESWFFIEEDKGKYFWSLEMIKPEKEINSTVKSIIDNYEEDELGFNFTISKYLKDSLEARRNTLIMLFYEIMHKDSCMRERSGASDVEIWSINDLIDTMKAELELFKRRMYDGK